MEKLHTCSDILHCMETSPNNQKALNTRIQEKWESISTEEFLEAVKFTALGLKEIGMQRGDRVGILANPSSEWTIVDMAIMIAGGVAVPLFGNISDDNFVYEAKESELNILIVEGDDQWAMFHRHSDLFKQVIAIGEIPSSEKQMTLVELKDKGQLADKRDPGLYRQMRDSIKPEDLAAIIYTSGSTGVPKGVELTHRNVTCILDFNEFNWSADRDSYLSVLPLAHVFGHCINLWVLAWGASVYYSTDYKNLGAICKEVRPTAIVVVPRLLEKIYAKINEQTNSATGLKHLIGKWAFDLAKNENPSFIDRLLHPIADKLVFGKFRDALGGKLRIVICGGAPLNPQIQCFFDNIGINIYEGWGLTEACPITVNRPDKHRAGTVGLPLDGHELKITSEGEVLVKGPLMMRGYYRHPELTAKAIDKDGWLHTGDRGVIDKDGYLILKGRMKELYKTSTGEYVAPVPIEQALGRYPLIDMSMVVAEGRKFASCLLFPNLDVLKREKAKHKAENLSDEEYLKSDHIRKDINKLIHEVNNHLNHWEEIHAYRFILEPLTIQKGELTPSMKIRREVVAKKYGQIIDEMYEEKE
ncbi:MAG TPA: long-chain fatty acid--CoA ligase [Parachlamydiaceae bacterium]|nr:long-chain fatty acid--CoA ligase [Parachlamydiaceae bacterium]